MKFEDWHVVENKETHQQHIFCGAKGSQRDKMERVSKSLIENALRHGLITFQMEFNTLAAKIGEYWFYISPDYEKTEKDYSTAELIDMIYESINDEPINNIDDEEVSECLYYKHFLETKLGI